MSQVIYNVFQPHLWPLRMILNDRYFIDILPRPKRTFANARDYYTYFQPLILEEVRAQLRFALHTLGERVHHRVVVERANKDSLILYLPRPVDPLAPSYMPDDFLLFTKDDVVDVDHINSYFFGIVKCYDEESELLKLRVHIAEDRFDQAITESDEIRITLLHNLTTPSHAIAAILRCEKPRFLDKLIRSVVRSSESAIQGEGEKDWKSLLSASTATALEKVCTIAPLNPAQMLAVASFLGRKDVCLVHGPPGCGKTTTIINMILTLLLSKAHGKILQVAPTNFAVEVIATRLLAILPLFGISLTQCILVGNKENLNLDGVLDNIFLDNRIIRVRQALGWLNQFHEAQRLLTKIIYDIDEQVINQDWARERQRDSEAKWFDKLKEAIADFSTCYTDLINYANILTFEFNSQLGRGGREVLLTVQSIAEEYLKCIRTLSPNAISRLRTASRDTCFALEQCAMLLKSEAPFLVDPNQSNSRDLIQSLIMDDVRVIFCTVAVAGHTVIVSRSDITTVIVDEASQLVEAENIIVLKQSCERLCLVADPKQLPATVQSQLGRHHGYVRSMFERLLNNNYIPCLLDEQYRMHPEISAWPIAQFYSGVLKNGPNTTSSSYTKPWHREEIFKPVLFIECADGREERDEKSSYSNAMEADIVITQLQHFFKVLARLDEPIQSLVSIGVITPYAAQVKILEGRIKNLAEKHSVDISVKSVDGFQGSERDIIIFSATRSNPQGNIGLLMDHRRLNVAITRPKFALWIIGNSSTLSKNDDIWSGLIQHCQDRRAYLNVRQQQAFTQLVKTHTQVLPAREFVRDPVLYKEDALDTGLWKLQFTQQSKADISILELPGRKIVVEIFLHLSEGHRNKHVLNGADVGKHQGFIKVQIRSGICVIWSVLLDNTCTQVIKIWRIVGKQNLQESVRRTAELILRSFTNEFIDLCAEGIYDNKMKRFIPRTFPAAAAFRWNKQALTVDAETTSTSTDTTAQSLAMKSSQVIKLLLQQNALDFEIPFEVSMEEQELIDCQGNDFILGRSGSGKTNVLVLRLLKLQFSYQRVTVDKKNGRYEKDQEEKEGEEEEEEKRSLRQIIVTASPKFCSAIQRYYTTMLPAVGLANQIDQNSLPIEQFVLNPNEDLDDNGELTGIPDRLEGLTYPQFLTFRQFLFMLDGTLSLPFFAPIDMLYPLQVLAEDDEDDAFDLDDFSGSKSALNIENVLPPVSSPARKRGKYNMSAEVTFDRFSAYYYPHFDQKVKKTLSPARLWTEIQSFIKGNITNLTRKSGFLSLEEYVRLAESRNSSILAKKIREQIYNKIFRSYEKLKECRKEWDMGDATLYIYRQLCVNGYTGDHVDFCYIDEVQDLLQTQIALCNFISPAQGFVFAGDTAQTISTGFRFEDLRLLFYKVFGSTIRDPDLRNIPAGIDNRVPPIRHLTQNYRSTSGVLKVANSIVRLLVNRFPDTIDKLNDEYSLTTGPRPVFLHNNSLDNFLLELFGGGQMKNSVDFGAEQAILVRTTETKEKLSKVLDMALVLTINEAKGLEFEDCLILNFFMDSPAGNAWRVIYNDVPNNTMPCPEFDIQKHQILATELKMLYVAATRAKVQLWFFDESTAHRQPMLDYWLSQNIVAHVATSDKNTLGSMAKKSTAAQWDRRGTELFHLKNYVVARKCFRIVGNDDKVKLCDGLLLMEQGDRAEGDKFLSLARKCFEEAANIFEELGNRKWAADAFSRASVFDKAARLYSLCGEHLISATCYKKAKLFHQAVLEYVQVQNLSEALKVCVEGKLWDLGSWIVGTGEEGYEPAAALKMERPSVSQDVRRVYIWKAAQHFNLCKNLPRMNYFLAMLPEHEDRRKFLKRFDLHELIQETMAGNNLQFVASHYQERGNLLKASELYIEANETESSPEQQNNNRASAIVVLLRWLRVIRPFDVTLSLRQGDFALVLKEMDTLRSLAKQLPVADKFGPLVTEARVLTFMSPSIGYEKRTKEINECFVWAARVKNPRLDLYLIQLFLLHHLELCETDPTQHLTFPLCQGLYVRVTTLRNISRNMITAMEDLDRQGTITQWSKWAEEYLEAFPHPANIPSKRRMLVLNPSDRTVSTIDIDVKELTERIEKRLYPLLVRFTVEVLEVLVKLRDKLEPCPYLFCHRIYCSRLNPNCTNQHTDVDCSESTQQRYELQSMIMELVMILKNPQLDAYLVGQSSTPTSVEHENHRACNLLLPPDLSVHDILQVIRFRDNSYVKEAVTKELEQGVLRMNDDDVAKTMIYRSIVPDLAFKIPDCEKSDLRRYLIVQAFLHENMAQNTSTPAPGALLECCNLLTSAVFHILQDENYQSAGKVAPYTLLLLCEKLLVNLLFLNRMNSRFKVVMLPKNLAGFHLLGREYLMSAALGHDMEKGEEIRNRTLWMIMNFTDTLRKLLEDAGGFFYWIQSFNTPPELVRHITIRFLSIYLLIGLNYNSYDRSIGPPIIIPSLQNMDILADDCNEERFPPFARRFFRWTNAPYKFNETVSSLREDNYFVEVVKLFRRMGDPVVIMKNLESRVPQQYRQEAYRVFSVNSYERPTEFTLQALFPDYYNNHKQSASAPQVAINSSQTNTEESQLGQANTTNIIVDKEQFISDVVNASTKLNASDVRSQISLPLHVVICVRLWAKRARAAVIQRHQVMDVKEQIEREAATHMDLIKAPEVFKALYLQSGTKLLIRLIHAIENFDFMKRMVQRPDVAVIWPEDARDEDQLDFIRVKKVGHVDTTSDEIKMDVVDKLSEMMEKLEEARKTMDYANPAHSEFNIPGLVIILEKTRELLRDTEPFGKLKESCKKIKKADEKHVNDKTDTQLISEHRMRPGRSKWGGKR